MVRRRIALKSNVLEGVSKKSLTKRNDPANHRVFSCADGKLVGATMAGRNDNPVSDSFAKVDRGNSPVLSSQQPGRDCTANCYER